MTRLHNNPKYHFKCDNDGICCSHLDKQPVLLMGQDIVRLNQILEPKAFLAFKPARFDSAMDDACFTIGKQRGMVACLKYNRKGECVLLGNGRCLFYDHRPAACRNYPFHCDFNVIQDSDKYKLLLNIDVDSWCKGIGFGNEINIDKVTSELRQEFNDFNKWFLFVLDVWAKVKNKSKKNFLALLGKHFGQSVGL